MTVAPVAFEATLEDRATPALRSAARLVRMVRALERSRSRIRRRVAALIAYLDTHPTATRSKDPELARLDDLIGQATRLDDYVYGMLTR